MMKRLPYAVTVFVFVYAILVSFEAMAQNSPQAHPQQGTEVTFDKNDLLNAMTDTERQDFLDRRKELKELQEAGRALKKEAPRKAVQVAFEAKQTEFEDKFGYLRGFRGKTVTVYGNPAPTKEEIMTQVINGGSLGAGLQPHWTREKSGAVVGSASRPKIETVSTSPATEVSKPKPRSTPRSSGQALTPEQHCRKHAGKPSSPGLKCKCNPPELEIFGIPTCWWYK